MLEVVGRALVPTKASLYLGEVSFYSIYTVVKYTVVEACLKHDVMTYKYRSGASTVIFVLLNFSLNTVIAYQSPQNYLLAASHLPA